MTEKRKILLVDDQKLFIEGLKILLESISNEFVLVGTANNGIDAIKKTEECLPDIVLMDVRMPEMDGVVATKHIHKKFPAIKILMLTTFSDDRYVHQALLNGASGYLLKDVSGQELIASVRAAYEGTVQISPELATRLVEIPHEDHLQLPEYEQENEDPLEWLLYLSRREKQILRLIGKEYDNREISEELFLAEQTVKNYVSIIYSRIDAKDRIEAMKISRSVPWNTIHL